ncbi:hypothetical protein ID856_06525 [Xenorhabdus sp. 18]|uniref:hypothetical protein n=1 Tax=Xenorhabdus doucetiae TaxID=351671 RepID=UPI00198733C4|nr:hypothetical protein [Xenorhabdus sp. 18]MBD2796195.1 hypothetical protein [Xenorhabdus sp. 18]
MIEHISDFLKENGLQVESQWILTGEGFPPQFAEYTKLDEDTLFILTSRTLPDVELVQVGGQYGEPYVNFGEFCIISNENSIESNNNKLCYVRYNEKVKIGVVTIMDEKQIIIPGKVDMILSKSNIIECRRVKWIQKK